MVKKELVLGIVLAFVVLMSLSLVSSWSLSGFLSRMFSSTSSSDSSGSSTFSLNCSDSDGGLNYVVQGTLTANGTITSYTDFCLTTFNLREYYCNGGDMASTSFNCSSLGSYTCSSGACVQQPACTSECTNGARQCFTADTYKMCGNYDADSCYEWSG
ncbi:MAG: hypothetical protein AABY10_05255, partial [Nanoarchaeota archaeon]